MNILIVIASLIIALLVTLRTPAGATVVGSLLAVIASLPAMFASKGNREHRTAVLDRVLEAIVGLFCDR